ncbi:MAG: 50S ribosomal protein L10 [Candidatus Pacearchaeota archaeon]|nr:50S ribosomal protein L10 [Candidatus Pacearchaeota archaeon]
MKKISENKRKALEELLNLINSYNTIMIISIKGISSQQLQKIKKELKDLVVFKVYKKKIMEKAFQMCKKENIIEMVENLEENYAVVFSNKDPFEIAALLAKNKIPKKVRAGQISPSDIILEAGPTDLPAGPALSEISKLGVKTSLEKGKIIIKETKVLVKKGEKVPEVVASVLSSLEIYPLHISPKPLTAYDSRTKKVYKNIEIDIEKIVQELRDCSFKAKTLALEIKYICKETIKELLVKAANQAVVLSKNLNN